MDETGLCLLVLTGVHFYEPRTQRTGFFGALCAKTGKKESFRRLRPSTGEREVLKRSPRADIGNQPSSDGPARLAHEGRKATTQGAEQ